jgi:hypothetical protein
MSAPVNDFLEDKLGDLKICSVNEVSVRLPEHTLEMGIASTSASSPRSPTMFLMRTDRSATSRSGDVLT